MTTRKAHAGRSKHHARQHYRRKSLCTKSARRNPPQRTRKQRTRIPLGVASNYRAYDPYPIFVSEGHGSKITDIDGNEYIDHNLCFGTLMAGHGHPAVVKAVKDIADRGTTFGMPHGMEYGTGRRNLRTLSRRDGSLRLQRHGSDHARLPHRPRRHRPRQNPAL